MKKILKMPMQWVIALGHEDTTPSGTAAVHPRNWSMCQAINQPTAHYEYNADIIKRLYLSPHNFILKGKGGAYAEIEANTP
jgi:hypothetical protein